MQCQMRQDHNLNQAIQRLVKSNLILLAQTEMEQKNIRIFKERIKDQESPFFVRCFIKLEGITFLLVLASASIYIKAHSLVMDFIIMRLDISFVQETFDNADLVNSRFTLFLNTPQSFRTIYDVYQKYEPKTSAIYSSRIASVANIVS